MTKKRFNLQQHEQTGSELYYADLVLTAPVTRMSKSYPLTDKASKKLAKALSCISEARSVLDDHLFKDIPNMPYPNKVYYGVASRGGED